MLIHQSQAGCVIGKAGSKLREMRQDFGVEVKVLASCCPMSTDRIVRVIGSPKKLVKCLVYIVEMLRTVSSADFTHRPCTPAHTPVQRPFFRGCWLGVGKSTRPVKIE